MPIEDPIEESEIFPEIIVDDENYVPSDDEPPPEPQPEPEPEVAPEPVVLAPPQHDDMFQTGKPVKKKRQISEKQRQHLDRIRAKALEKKKENAESRKKERQKTDPPPPVVKPIQPPSTVQAPVPAPAPQYLTHDDVESILDRYKAKRQVRKKDKAKEAAAQQMVQTHITKDDVWEQCFM